MSEIAWGKEEASLENIALIPWKDSPDRLSSGESDSKWTASHKESSRKVRVSLSHTGNPQVVPCCPPQELGADCEPKDKRNPRNTNCSSQESDCTGKGLTASSRCNPGHSPDPAEFGEVFPSANFISDGLFPRIFIYILTTWVSTPLKVTQNC